MSVEEIQLDFARTDRIGFGEAVFCINKTPTQINLILDQTRSKGASILLTRLGQDKYEELSEINRDDLDYDHRSETGFFMFQRKKTLPEQVAIISAGTSDTKVAKEASRTLDFNYISSKLFLDLGVAGLWRLTSQIESIKQYPVIIAVAGMDAALISVLGGLVSSVIIAVPTSTGYGMAREGKTALAASLTSCAPGIVVCNIDNGYGAACGAIRVIQSANLRFPTDKG